MFLALPAANAGPGFIANSKVSQTDSDGSADIQIRFNCKAVYLRHEPVGGGDRLRIYLDPTGICNGTSPLVAESRSRLRPRNADKAQLFELEYNGESSKNAVLTLVFSQPVRFNVEMSGASFDLNVHVNASDPATHVDAAASGEPVAEEIKPALHRQVIQDKGDASFWAVNLKSFQRPPTSSDAFGLSISADRHLYYNKVVINGQTWYRLRVGDFDSVEDASKALPELTKTFPGAWIDSVNAALTANEVALTPQTSSSDLVTTTYDDQPGTSKVDLLLEDARKLMVTGDTSRAVQIYTKILQLPEHPRQPEAQEYLALAREKKGQLAHAKAEYQRFLSLYPENEGAERVRQRLATLLASDRQQDRPSGSPDATGIIRSTRRSIWRLQVYASQYYRRDVNQQNDADEVVSQSALYSDINVDARRRGDRFDFSSRITAGYRNDFLDDAVRSADPLRISYAYIDVADANTGIRARVGRQSRNTGGILGRFDGLNLSYDLNEQFTFRTVYGMPAYTSSDGVDSERSFYGVSASYRPPVDGMELGLFYIQQDIVGVTDRQAVGGEFRYFGEKQSVWGLVDYDTAYQELGSAFLQTSWRFGSRLSLHGSLDRRHSPFLSAGNALIGQAVASFTQLLELYSVAEIRQFGLDRSPLSTTYTLGVSHSMTPKLQLNVDVNQSSIDESFASGGVLATPANDFNYYSASLIASSLLKEGDVSIFSVRFSDSDTSRVTSFSIDSRFPFGRIWRLNPRLRVDRRERLNNSSSEWLYTPGIRIQFRRSQKLRIDFEAGKQFSRQDAAGVDLDRESYFVNLGYQVFF